MANSLPDLEAGRDCHWKWQNKNDWKMSVMEKKVCNCHIQVSKGPGGRRSGVCTKPWARTT